MSRGPNTRFADLFALTGWSKGELARLVNRRGAAVGQQQLSTDTSRVRRWIERGEVPRDPVPRVLAALFTERLGRVVTTEDLGFQRHRHTGSGSGAKGALDDPSREPERTAEVLTEFTGMDLMLNRRGLMGASTALVAGAAIAGPLHDWMTSRETVSAARPGTSSGAFVRAPGAAALPAADAYQPGPVGLEEVEALENSVDVFRAWDASRGGGLQRKAVVGQLNEVGGMLGYPHSPALARRLWTVAANLSVLAGWMSHDVGLEPTAQKYFVMAAHAAREADDRPRAGEALSRAARQMVHLGRPADALDLLRGAESGSGEDTLPRTRAMLRTVEAWAQASMGRSQATRRTLGEAEDLFAQDNGDPGPGWLQFFDRADLHGMEALAYRTLAEHDPSAAPLAQFHARQALDLRSGGHERSMLFDRLSMASACYIANKPEEASKYARLALTSTSEMSSHRTWDRLREMYRLSGRYEQLSEVGELRSEIRKAMPQQPRPQII
ncbi:DNA-binding protein NsdB [Streptacidiphilus cavernicola]|uniref:Regulatory protein n=1 Tax=Streptacidiphilus cavernicola TaxID=3342716 RepID=A0ABV6VYK7_9ACTN